MNSCLICDDHTMMREALVGCVLLAWPRAKITQAADFPSAWAQAAAQPAFCICDLVMPGAAPVEGIRSLRSQAPKTPILVVTGNDEDAVLLALFELGIAGFVPKTSNSSIIEAAIRLILAGGRYLPPRIAELATGRARSDGADALPPPPVFNARLTDRQLNVLRLMALGQSNKEIAKQIGLSPATVKAHVAAAMAALGAVNRTEAALRARELGLI